MDFRKGPCFRWIMKPDLRSSIKDYRQSAPELFKTVTRRFRVAARLFKTGVSLSRVGAGRFRVAADLFGAGMGRFNCATGLFTARAKLFNLAANFRRSALEFWSFVAGLGDVGASLSGLWTKWGVSGGVGGVFKAGVIPKGLQSFSPARDELPWVNEPDVPQP
jgi:hypothetical protein